MVHATTHSPGCHFSMTTPFHAMTVQALETPLHIRRLTFQPEGDNVLVGCAATTAYAVLPADAAALLERLVAGATPTDAADWYERTYGETVDIADFISALTELGFLGEVSDDASEVVAPVGLQRCARALFSVPAFVAYALLVAAWVITLLRHPSLAPAPRHIFFTDSLILAQLVLLFGQMPLLLFHESFHVLAGRRLGLPSRVGLGRRLWVVVVETRMPDLLAVPRRQRYLPFLAGMLADVLAICTLGLIADILRDGGSAERLIARLALAMAFPVCIRFAYQFLLFLETDVYYVITTALGCYDLHAASRARLVDQFSRWWGRTREPTDASRWTPRDRQVARWYAPGFAIGAAVLLVVAVKGLIPVIADCIEMIAASVRSGNHLPDTLAFVGLTVLQFAIYGVVLVRSRARRTPTNETTPLSQPA